MFNIRRNLNLDVTTVSNKFITKLMPRANGDYVKIYLYFLCISSTNDISLDLKEIANKLEYTPEFIVDALLYWEKIGVIEGAYNGSGELVSMTFLDVPEIDELELEETIEVEQELEINKFNNNEEAFEEVVDVFGASEIGKSKDITISNEKLEELCEKSDVQMIMLASEQYLGHTLSPSEIELFLYLYDTCNFSADLIDYLVEYCVSNGHKSIHYIREVAFAWYEGGIDSVTKAKATRTTYHQDYIKIRNALGLKRSLGDVELEYFNKWINEYPVDIDIVVEACNRTMLNVGKPELRYVDTILRDWISKGYRSVEEIKENTIVSATKKTSNSIIKKTSFDNFEERKYDTNDDDELMKKKAQKLREKAYANISSNVETLQQA